MTIVFRTIVVPAALADVARNLGACLTPSAAEMFLTPLSANGLNPASWYVSSGVIDASFDALLLDANLLYSQAVAGATAQGLILTATLSDCQNLVAQATVVDVNTEGPFDTFARLGLKIVSDPIV